MFEFDQEAVDSLLEHDNNFRRLYEKHRTLKDQVHEANIGTLPIDSFELERLKKQKLQLKDEMANIIDSFRRERRTA